MMFSRNQLCLLSLLAVGLPLTARANAECNTGDTYCDFGPGFIYARIGPKSLLTEAGSLGADGWYIEASNKIRPLLLVATDPLDFRSETTVNVKVTFKSVWFGLAPSLQALSDETVFDVLATWKDSHGKTYASVRGIRFTELGEMRIIAPPSEESQGLTYYFASSGERQVFSLPELTMPDGARDFQVSLRNLAAGASLTVLDMRINGHYQNSLSTVPATAYAPLRPRESMISCDESKSLASSGCTVQSVEVLSDLGFQHDVTLDYEYNCKGTPIDILVWTDAGHKEILARSTGRSSITLTAEKFLRVEANDPTNVEPAFVQKGCSLKITGVTLNPSAATYEDWRVEERHLVETIKDKYNLWRLAQSLDVASIWHGEHLAALRSVIAEHLDSVLAAYDTSYAECFNEAGDARGTNGFPKGWYNAMVENPVLAQYYEILQYINDAKQNIPTSIGPEALKNAASRVKASLGGYCRSEVVDAIQRAQSLVERFRRYKMAASEQMRQTLDEVAHGLTASMSSYAVYEEEGESCGAEK